MKALFSIVLVLIFANIASASEADRVIDLDPQVIHYGATTPVFASKIVPEMPQSIADVDGNVVLQFSISKRGNVSNISVLNASDDTMAKYCLGMVRKWKFAKNEDGFVVKQPIVFDAAERYPTLLALN